MTFKSITGLTVNDPAICIKGNGNFACVCPNCMKELADFVAKQFPPLVDN